MVRACLVLTCALALCLAGCSGSGGSAPTETAGSGTTAGSATTSAGTTGGTASGGSTETGGSTTVPAAAVTLTVVQSKLGAILADGNGRTVYLFTPDKTNKSVCTGPCTADWPPLASTGAPTVGDGVDSSLVKTFKRPDGSVQVSYAGHPLYTFSEDGGAGDVNGQSVGGVWFAVQPSGKQAG